IAGGLIGIAFGVSLSKIIASAAGWSTLVTGSSIGVAFGVSVFIGLLFGIYSAVQGAKLDPIGADCYGEENMLFGTLLFGFLLTAGAFAQVSSFPKPNYFRETFQKARTTVELKDPVKLRDYVANGKLELSLQHYLELVMANNTDIQIQFLTIEQP